MPLPQARSLDGVLCTQLQRRVSISFETQSFSFNLRISVWKLNSAAPGGILFYPEKIFYSGEEQPVVERRAYEPHLHIDIGQRVAKKLMPVRIVAGFTHDKIKQPRHATQALQSVADPELFAHAAVNFTIIRAVELC